MKAPFVIAALALSMVCLQCTRLGPVSGSDDPVGIWGGSALQRGASGQQTVVSAPSSTRQLLREVNLKVDYVSKRSRFRKSARPMAPRYITIHSTENYSPAADSEQHSKALKNGRLPAIWHFTVDDRKAIQHLPLNEQGVHADINRPGYSAPGNRYSIGIEMCEYRGCNRAATLERTAKLTAYLMHKNDIPLSRVVPHYHWPRAGKRPPNKACPHFLMTNGRPGAKWRWFLGRVNYYYNQSGEQHNYASR